jgi:hypothetical protein
MQWAHFNPTINFPPSPSISTFRQLSSIALQEKETLSTKLSTKHASLFDYTKEKLSINLISMENKLIKLLAAVVFVMSETLRQHL